MAGNTQIDQCPRCYGAFFDPGEAGAVLGPAADPASWGQGAQAIAPSGNSLHCCDNHGPMWTYVVSAPGGQLPVFACGTCRGVWLDHAVARSLAAAPPPAVSPSDAAEDAAPPPGVATYLFQAFTGMPVEVWNPVRRKPVVVYSLVAALTVVYAIQFVTQVSDPQAGRAIVENWALVPADLLAGRELYTLLTHAFLHGNLPHLLGNLYFLWIFGDNVEDALRPGRFVALYTAAAVAGGLLHALGQGAAATTPMLGASGAISGLLGAYLVLYPRVRVWVVLFFVRLKIRVQWYLLVWVGIQVLSFLANQPGVAWLAHVGGFLAGSALGFLWRDRAAALGATPPPPRPAMAS